MLNILYSCKSIAMKFSSDILMTLDFKRIHNLPPHLSYVSTLPDIFKKSEKLRCFPLSNVSGSEKNRFCCV